MLYEYIVDFRDELSISLFIVLNSCIHSGIFQLHFHRTPNNYECVYDYLPRKCLPKDFGGELDSVDVLHGLLLITIPILE